MAPESNLPAENHTPGPWAIKPRSPAEIRLKRPHWEVGSMATRKGIAFAFGDTDADARLIAAAPDLLAALCAVWADDQFTPETEKIVRDAIEKATGK